MLRGTVADYLDRLPRGETVDLFTDLCGPVAARILAHILGLDEVGDADMQRWSQVLIDGAGNFGFADEPFARSDAANAEMDAVFDSLIARHLAEPNNSAFSVMLNARDPIPEARSTPTSRLPSVAASTSRAMRWQPSSMAC